MKIYDCFTFFNELDVLEIRLNILNDKVDYFVLVEATTTHSGKKKELYFENNKSRYSKFLNKIIHVIVDDMPELKDDRWVLENFQRNAIMRGLSDCKEDDVIMISDLDEIPNIKDVNYIKNRAKTISSKNDVLYKIYYYFKTKILNIKSNTRIVKYIKILTNYLSIKSSKLIVFKQNFYFYYLNGFINNEWLGSKIVMYKNLINDFNSSPQQIRSSSAKNIIENGGWHFSYLFTPEGISNKIKSFAHSEFDKTEYTDTNTIETKIKKGENIFGRDAEKITYVKINNSYPEYIINNTGKYEQLINNNVNNQ
ncbi:MAG: hypothetical protein WC827_02185 [Candidatus Paceibacterota bacterium]